MGGSSSASMPDGVSLDGLVVLVVDDQADARELVTQVLSGAGAQVLAARTADEALALVQSHRPQLVISDIGMPDKDGYQLMRELRRMPVASGGRTPALALTAFARSEDRTRALLAGYQGHMAKPIEPRELVLMIGSLAGLTGWKTS
jgi:CheY-like chemotaxis protein